VLAFLIHKQHNLNHSKEKINANERLVWNTFQTVEAIDARLQVFRLRGDYNAAAICEGGCEMS
jgi:hypothetical protein